jgi:tripartite ATP-independent transporter DctP family solute receptor
MVALATVCLAVLALPYPGVAQTFQMKIAGVYPDLPVPMYVGTDTMKARIDELAKGKFQINVRVYKGTLGGERQAFQGMQTGTVEACACSTTPAAGFAASWDLFNLPFLFNDYDHVYRVVDGPIGAELAKQMLDKGIRVLGYWTIGPRVAYNSVRPINQPSDFKGLKIRVPETPPLVAYYQAMGAIPAPISRPEVYMALKQGVVNGVDATFEGGINFKDYEIAKFAPELDHAYTIVIMAVSERWWKTLPKGLQDIIVQAEAEARPKERAADRVYSGQMEKKWIELGGQVTHPDRAPFRALAQKTWPESYASVPRELIDAAVKAGTAH